MTTEPDNPPAPKWTATQWATSWRAARQQGTRLFNFCGHTHRQRRTAQECADKLNRKDITLWDNKKP